MPDRKIEMASHQKKREMRGQSDFFLTENRAFLAKGNPSTVELRNQVRLLTAQMTALLERLREAD